MSQRHKDITAEERPTSRHRSPPKLGWLTRQRAPGGIDHWGHTNRAAKYLRPLLLPAIVVLSIAAVGLHVVGGLVLLKTGLSGLSQGPLAYAAIGLCAMVAVIKLAHAVRMLHRKRKSERTH